MAKFDSHPLTEEKAPVALFRLPPDTLEFSASASFANPPLTDEQSASATLPYPPVTQAYEFLDWFADPKATEYWPETLFRSPATRPPSVPVHRHSQLPGAGSARQVRWQLTLLGPSLSMRPTEGGSLCHRMLCWLLGCLTG